MRKWVLAAGMLLGGVGIMQNAISATIEVPMYQVAQVGFGKKIGTVTLKDSKYGLLLIPNLSGLSPAPGTRGFHVHETPNCDNFGLAAQGHFDPEKKNKHLGPYDDNGTLGDLPPLIIDSNGTATLPLLAPRLSLKIIQGHSLIIHMGGDNFSDNPDKNGGGGDRFACGIIPIVPGTQTGTPGTTGTTSTTGTSDTTNKYGIDVETSETVPLSTNTTPATPPANPAKPTTKKSTPSAPTNVTAPVTPTKSPTTTPVATPNTTNATPTTSLPADITDQDQLTPEQTQDLLNRKKQLQQMQEDNMKQLDQLNKQSSPGTSLDNPFRRTT